MFQSAQPSKLTDILARGFQLTSDVLPSGWFIIESSIFCGKRPTVYVLGSESDLVAMMDSPAPTKPSGRYAACPGAPTDEQSAAVFSDWAQENVTPDCPEQWIGLSTSMVRGCFLADLTPDEALCLAFTCSLKNSYGGKSDIRYTEARASVGSRMSKAMRARDGARQSILANEYFPRERWESAQNALRARGLVNKVGSVTDDGRNLREHVDGFRGY